jgi:hypothetical protein
MFKRRGFAVCCGNLVVLELLELEGSKNKMRSLDMLLVLFTRRKSYLSVAMT